jgi:hypothetical protein
VGRLSLSFRCFLFPTRISAFWRVARRWCGALWSTARGRRHCPSSRTLIGCLIHPLSAAGRATWTVLSLYLPFSARPSPAWLIGWFVVIRLWMKRGRCRG